MKLSPLDIYNKEFKKTTFGYNVNQVDAFLEEVGMAYERLLKEVNKLHDEKERLEEKLSNYEAMEEKLEKMIATVHDTAREQTKQARKEADMIIKKAEVEADKMIQETREKLQEEYRALQELKGNKDLFKIRFKTLLESHLQMLEEDEDDLEIPEVEKDIAAEKLDLD